MQSNYMNTKFFAAVAATLAIVACSSNEMKPQEGYIGPSQLEITDGHMTPEVLLALGRLGDPQLSPDGKTILYGVSYTDIAANRSVRNLFTIPVEGGEPTQLTMDGKSIASARWSNDGNAIFFLQGGQLYKAPYKNGKLGKRVQLTSVEKGIDDYLLSPDQNQLLYVSTVHSAVEVPSDTDPLLDKAEAYATEDLMYRHWDHWRTEINHTFLATLVNGVVKEGMDILGEDLFELPNGPFGDMADLAWSPDGQYVAFSCKMLTGKQYAFSTNTCIYLYSPLTGEISAVTTQGGYDTHPVWSPDGSRLLWLSMERDGYEADKVRLMMGEVLYATEEEGQSANPEVVNIRDLTASFKYNVDGPVWAADGESVYFAALTEGVQAIYNLIPDQEPVRLTADNLWFDFGSPFGVLQDGTLLTTYASMDFPTELVAVAGNSVRQITFENEHLLGQLDKHETEARWLDTVDGQKMLTWVLYPPQFDASKTYPAIEICLGGPQGTLSQGWSYRWNYLLMCHQGYVVVLPNRRGTTAFGQPWCEEISGDYIGLNMQDYLTAARNIKAEPYVSGVAACGASYGGYSVYYLAGIHKDVYDCFIAHAGIFNEEHMYFTTEEMWFPNWDNGGLHEYAYQEGQVGPAGDGVTFGGLKQGGSPWSKLPKAQRHYANSPHKLVQNWHTPILCIHGGSDFRVPVDEGMAAFNVAQMMGVPSKLIVFPGENHWILKPQNALYWHRSYFDWLDRWMKDQEICE